MIEQDMARARMIEIQMAVQRGLLRDTAERLRQVNQLEHELEDAKSRAGLIPAGLRSGRARA